MRSLGFRRTLAVLGIFAGVLALGLLTPCTPASSVKPITVGLKISPIPSRFSTSEGWSVLLTQALLSVQRIEFYDGEAAYAASFGTVPRLHTGEPEVVRPWSVVWWETPSKALFSWPWEIEAAHAHPGHDNDGTLKGESLPAKALDLLTVGGIDLGLIAGFSGYWGIADIRLDPKSLVVLAGKATKEGQTIPFSFQITGDPSQVPGIAVRQTLEAAASLTLEIQPSGWFALFDFSVLPQTEGKATLPADSLQTTIFHKALIKPTSYVFSKQ